MNREIFKYVTGVNDAMLNQLDLESVNTAVGTIGQMMEEYKPKGIDRFCCIFDFIFNFELKYV